MSYGQNMRATSSFSKPVETRKEYTVAVTDTGRDGDGVTRISGLVIFVKMQK